MSGAELNSPAGQAAQIGQAAPKLSVEQMTMQIAAMLDPAFPVVLSHMGQLGVVGGLSKREYFAAQAVQGILASNSAVTAHSIIIAEDLAESACKVADALIKALAAPKVAPPAEVSEVKSSEALEP